MFENELNDFFELLYVEKSNLELEKFDIEKLKNSIKKALQQNNLNKNYNIETLNEILNEILRNIKLKTEEDFDNKKIIKSKIIGDIIEIALMEKGLHQELKSFILYRSLKDIEYKDKIKINNLNYIDYDNSRKKMNLEEIKKEFKDLTKDLGLSYKEYINQLKKFLIDNLKIDKINKLKIKAAIDNISVENINWNKLAGRLTLKELYLNILNNIGYKKEEITELKNNTIKKISKQIYSKENILNVLNKLTKKGYYFNKFNHFYTDKDIEKAISFIDIYRDLEYDHNQLSSFKKKYLLNYNGIDLESPQIMYLFNALFLSIPEGLYEIKNILLNKNNLEEYKKEFKNENEFENLIEIINNLNDKDKEILLNEDLDIDNILNISKKILLNEYLINKRLNFTKKIYEISSKQELSLPTPTLSNARTNKHQLSSCFKLNTDDDLRGIFHTIENMAQISKFGGGIGSYLGHIRAKGSDIRGIQGASGGILPWIKIINDTAIAVNQLGCVSGNSELIKLEKIIINGKEYLLKDEIKIDGKFYNVSIFTDNGNILSKIINFNVEFISKRVDGKTIKEGDYVLSYNIEKKEKGFCKVNHVFRPIVKKEYQVEIISNNGSKFITSVKHPTLVLNENKKLIYLKPSEIDINKDKIVLIEENGKIKFDNIKSLKIGNNFKNVDEQFIDFEIDKNNNYFAGEKGKKLSVVHNSRAGAISTTIDIWHLDILDFLEMQTETGDIRRKAFDVFPAVSIPDLFMKRVENDENWTLFDPKEIRDKIGKRLEDFYGEEFEKNYIELENNNLIKLKETINAKELFKQFLKTVVETGMPYVFFRDTVNKNNPNKHKGMIYSSQLCVTGDTIIHTGEGLKRIGDLYKEKKETPLKVLIDNRSNFDFNNQGVSLSNSIGIYKTAEQADVYKITTKEGYEIKATKWHKFYKIGSTKNNKIEKVELKDLKIGDKLLIQSGQGIFGKIGDYNFGVKIGNKLLQNEKINENELINLKIEGVKGLFYTLINKNLNYLISKLDIEKEFNIITLKNNKENLNNTKILQILLTNLGFFSKITNDNNSIKIIIIGNKNVIDLLIKLGFKLNYNKNTNNTIKNDLLTTINKIEYIGKENVYDTTETKNHSLIFNGIVTGNCTEILQNTSEAKFIEEKTENGNISIKYKPGESVVCNLASINVAKVNFKTMSKEKIEDLLDISMRLLDNVITLNSYPIEESKLTGMKYRAVGLGYMGLAEYFANTAKIRYDSEEAINHVDEMFEKFAYLVLKKEIELAKERGKYKLFNGSDWSKGIILGKSENELLNNTILKDKWKKIINGIKKYGIRNGYLFSPAPNTSCQSGHNEMIMLDGSTKSIYNILKEQGFNIEEIEKGSQKWIELKGIIKVPTKDGIGEVKRIWYNGYQPVKEIIFKDGLKYQFTYNHKLLVKKDGKNIWIRVDELKNGDNIVNINKNNNKIEIKKIIDKKEQIPTYDFEVDKIHHYLLSNGCVSHNTSLVVGTTAGLLPVYKKYFVETNSTAANVNVAPNLNKENFWLYKEYVHMNMKNIIPIIATIQKWIDQSISFEWIIDPSKTSPKDLYEYYIQGWKSGLKTVYYVRSMSLEVSKCESCAG